MIYKQIQRRTLLRIQRIRIEVISSNPLDSYQSFYIVNVISLICIAQQIIFLHSKCDHCLDFTTKISLIYFHRKNDHCFSYGNNNSVQNASHSLRKYNAEHFSYGNKFIDYQGFFSCTIHMNLIQNLEDKFVVDFVQALHLYSVDQV